MGPVKSCRFFFVPARLVAIKALEVIVPVALGSRTALGKGRSAGQYVVVADAKETDAQPDVVEDVAIRPLLSTRDSCGLTGRVCMAGMQPTTGKNSAADLTPPRTDWGA
jgi:hypothetical protein